MRIGTRIRTRSAFTLLEVLLASLIAILLMSALYVAMDVTLRQTHEGRDAVDADSLSRGVYNRMSLDLSASLGPLPPKSGGNSAGSSASTASTPTTPTDPTMPSTTTTTPSTTTPSTTSTTPATGSTAAADPTTGDVAAVPQAADIGFQAGIIGTDKQLTVFASRLPSAMSRARGLSGDAAAAQGPSDLVRITYWIGGSGGLCRQERPWVTADGVRNSSDPDLDTESGDTLVQEVKDVTFEYFDGSQWLAEWDGSKPSPDGVTPTGPPRAVKVTLTYSIPAAKKGQPPLDQKVVQVIPVRAAPGSFTPEMITPSTDTGAATDPAMTGTTTSSATSNMGAKQP
ncbi:MAG: hypothetical protein U0791_21485 [Gemmataceae bacterium]